MSLPRRAVRADRLQPEPLEIRTVKFSFGPELMDIECGKCGASRDWHKWTFDRFGNERELGHFQCPVCHYAFKVVKTPLGLSNRIEPVQPTL